MNKNLKTLIVTLLSCLCYSSWAQTTFDFTSGTWELPFTKASYTISGDKCNSSYTPGYNSINHDVRFYAKNTMTVANADGKIDKIVFSMSARGKERWGKLTASCGNVTFDTTNGITTWECAEGTESVTFTVPDTNDYGTDGKGKNGMFCFDHAQIYRSNILLTNVSFGAARNNTYTFKNGVLGGFTTPKAAETNGYEGTLTYTSSDDNIAAVDRSTGKISITGYGKADITATFIPNNPDAYLTNSDKYTVVNRKKTEAGNIVFSSDDNAFEAVGTSYKSGTFTFVASDGEYYTFNTTNAALNTTIPLLRIKSSTTTSPAFPKFANGYTVKVTYSTNSGSITLKSGTKSASGGKGGSEGKGMEVTITTSNTDPFTIISNSSNVVYISKIEITTDSPSTIDLDELYANGIIAKEDINVTLKRAMVVNEWNTICLPFAVTTKQAKKAFGEDVKIAALNPDAAADNNVLSFKYVEAIEAGKPYIIKPTTESPADGYAFEGVKTTEDSPSVEKSQGGIGFVGIYNPVDITDDVQANNALSDATRFAAFLGDGDRLYKANDKSTTKGFRAYFAIPESASPTMYIAIDGSMTSIKDIHTDSDTDAPTYNMQGQRVSNNSSHGIYIKKGKKFIVR